MVVEVACYTRSVHVHVDTPSRTLGSPEEEWMLEWRCGMYERRPVEELVPALGSWVDRDGTSQWELVVRFESACYNAEGSTGASSGYVRIGRGGQWEVRTSREGEQ